MRRQTSRPPASSRWRSPSTRSSTRSRCDPTARRSELARTIAVRDDLGGVDWRALNDALTGDRFNNGRTPEELRRSFENSYATAIVGSGGEVIATARLLADGVCNAWLVDVWTASANRRQGIGSAVVRRLLERVPGHHVALFTEEHVEFYRSLGFDEERTGMSLVVGSWLNRD